MRQVRCAVYTRKSSDEGLEQDFNSLDAQREACAAYVKSQASEAWKLISEQYDDGGISGGTLERPALQRLLTDVKDGRIDIIVVYKVDRLTRSLLDFAKLVETFDQTGTSFVSVTQSFNTTTSMGRLTLNMLLSFAQFEREVTAERIRDKIAASKAKGMWMGGTPPLGYRPDGRSLAVVDDHAAIIRDIFARYRALGNVRLVQNALEREGVKTPRRSRQSSGKPYGGYAFSRGQLYAILKNPVYAGNIGHKAKTYPGNHPAIIPREEWDGVQRQLASNRQGSRQLRQSSASMLAGLLFDEKGEPLVPVHTTKSAQGGSGSGQRRYRYYVRRSDQHGTSTPGVPPLRLPAREIEQAVRQELAALFEDPIALLHRLEIALPPASFPEAMQTMATLSSRLRDQSSQLPEGLVEAVTVHAEGLTIAISPAGVAALIGVDVGSPVPAPLLHHVPVHLTRTGRAVRLIQDSGAPAASSPDPALLKLLIKARRWWRELSSGDCDIAALSRREQVSDSYVTRVVRLAFLAPSVVDAVLEGTIRPKFDAKALLAAGAIPPSWEEQAAKFIPS